MSSALDQRVIQVQKLVFLPFQVGTCVRTLVVIGKKSSVFVDHKDRPGFAIDLDLEALAAGVLYVGSFAENV